MMQTLVKGDTRYAMCLDCERLQELELRDWPESKMCDNCAFRKGSPERKDPYRWAEVQELLASGQFFHCHKGLPFDHKSGQFEPPSKDAGRVTVCAGWLATYNAQLNRAAIPSDQSDNQPSRDFHRLPNERTNHDQP